MLGGIYISSPWFGAWLTHCFDQWNFSGYDANKGLICGCTVGLFFLSSHFSPKEKYSLDGCWSKDHERYVEQTWTQLQLEAKSKWLQPGSAEFQWTTVWWVGNKCYALCWDRFVICYAAKWLIHINLWDL